GRQQGYSLLGVAWSRGEFLSWAGRDSPAGGDDADDAGQRADGDERGLGDGTSRGDRGRRHPGPGAVRRDGQAPRPGSPHPRALLESPGLRPAGAWKAIPWLLALPRFAAPGTEA